jgi:glycosyltransferase involved in cell wall biosynthesis
MVVLMVIHDLTGGGAEQQLNYLAPELVNRGHNVHIYYCKEGPNKVTLSGVTLHKARKSSGDLTFFWEIFMLSKKLKPDIIHTWLLKMDILGGLVALVLIRKWVLREPSSKSAYPPNFKNVFRILLAKLSDAILCNSINGFDYWKDKVKLSKIHIITNGLPLKLIDSVLPIDSTNFFVNGPILLYAGRIVEGKNIDLLIRALAVLNEKKIVNCIICGDGDLRCELQTLVKELGLEERILFLGHLSQRKIWGLMKTVTGYVSLSAFEGCPNTTLEAMACGVPIFLSDIPAHLEIADNNSAFIIDVTDTNNISSTFENFLNDFEKLNQKSEIALNRVSKFSIENMVNYHLSVYQAVI